MEECEITESYRGFNCDDSLRNSSAKRELITYQHYNIIDFILPIVYCLELKQNPHNGLSVAIFAKGTLEMYSNSTQLDTPSLDNEIEIEQQVTVAINKMRIVYHYVIGKLQ